MPNRSSNLPSTDLRCYYQNVRGLNSKVDYFYSAISDSEFDLISIAETWLTEEVSSSELFQLSVYDVFRCDRKFCQVNKVRGGGVLIAVKNHFKSEILPTCHIFASNCSEIDLLVVKVEIGNHLLHVITVYIPGDIPLETFELFFEYMEQFQFLYNGNTLIFGDFNVPRFVANDSMDSKKSVILNFMNIYNFNQFNNITNYLDRILDLVISDNFCVISHDNDPLVPEDSHHPALDINIKVKTPFSNFKTNINTKVYNFRKADFPSLYNALLETNWDPIVEYNDANTSVENLYQVLNTIFDKYIPLYKNYSHKYPAWFDREIITMVKLKAKHRMKFKKFGNQHDDLEYRKLRTLSKNLINVAYSNYIENAQMSLVNNPKNFWNFVQSKKNSSRIPGEMKYQNNIISSAQGVVDTFAEFFRSVYVQSSKVDRDQKIATMNVSNIILHPVTYDETVCALKKLKNKMTSGSDDIPSFLVNDCAIVLAKPLTTIFNLCLKTNVYPQKWKETRICPIFKSGDKANIENYRSVALLCNFSKAFEIILYQRICPLVVNQISAYQHGFINGRSTTTNLIIMTQYLSEILDRRGQVDVIYTDFSKAFDKIDHGILLGKLRCFGFTVDAIAFLHSYLTNRKLFVAYNGYSSFMFEATSGVPQGSVLGPLLFLLFINDLCESLSCSKLCFADDLKIYSCINTVGDCIFLQSQLNLVYKWCFNNKLNLNISKCKSVSFSRKLCPINFIYEINNEILVSCNSVKDLGIVFDKELSFRLHISSKVAEAMKAYGFIIRNCRNFSNLHCLKTLYYSYVRSKLEYNSIIWNPIYSSHITIIEKVQRKFLKFLSFKIDGIYPANGIENRALCDRFEVKSLELRRTQAGLVFLHKLLHNKVNCMDLLAMLRINVPQHNTRLPKFFNLPLCLTNLMTKSPIYRICTNYNNIHNRCDIFNCSISNLMAITNLYDYS